MLCASFFPNTPRIMSQMALLSPQHGLSMGQRYNEPGQAVHLWAPHPARLMGRRRRTASCGRPCNLMIISSNWFNWIPHVPTCVSLSQSSCGCFKTYANLPRLHPPSPQAAWSSRDSVHETLSSFHSRRRRWGLCILESWDCFELWDRGNLRRCGRNLYISLNAARAGSTLQEMAAKQP